MKNQAKQNEARHFSRIKFSLPTTLINPQNNESWQCNLIDISLHGALISRPNDWNGELNQTYLLNLFLAEDSKISMEVLAVHIEQKSLGFSCQHISLDSVTHLRRLVELNLADEDLLERELNELIHIND